MKITRTVRTLFCAVLFCCLLFSLIACGGAGGKSPAGSTEGLLCAQNSDGTYTVTGYEGTAADVVVDTHEGAAIRAVAAGAFAGNETVHTVTLGASVREIGVAAFANCSALVSVDASASAVARVSNAAFLGCDALRRVALPATVNNVGVDAFLACDALEELSFGGDADGWMHVAIGAHNDALEDVVTLGDGTHYAGAFRSGNCTSAVKWTMDENGVLTVLGEGHIPDYSEIDSAPWSAYAAEIKAVVIEDGIDIVGKNAFGGCTALTSVTLADSVRLIEDSAFYGCASLAELALPANLRRIGSGAFYGCAALRSLVIPDSVTHVGGGAFMNCGRLETVTLSAGLTAIEQWTFSGCEQLRAVEIPAGVTKISVGAFYGCYALETVTMGGAEMTVEKNAFGKCDCLADVIYRGDWHVLLTVADGNDCLVTATFAKEIEQS